MKMYDIDGQLVNIDVRQKNYPVRARSRSKIQQHVGEILQELYPRDIILEEFIIPGSRLSVDFFLPMQSKVIEVQGGQHDEHVPFFHGDKRLSTKFAQQLKRDAKKAEWIDLNAFDFIEIREGMSDDGISDAITR